MIELSDDRAQGEAFFDIDTSIEISNIETFSKKKNVENWANALEKRYTTINELIERGQNVVDATINDLNKYRTRLKKEVIGEYREIITAHQQIVSDTDTINDIPGLEVINNYTYPKDLTRKRVRAEFTSIGVGIVSAVNSSIRTDNPIIAIAAMTVGAVMYASRKRKAIRKLEELTGEVNNFVQEAVGIMQTLKAIYNKTTELHHMHVKAKELVNKYIDEVKNSNTETSIKKLYLAGQQLERLISIELS